MVKKKHKAKNSQGNQAVSQRPRKKILGLDVRDLGAAIAAAVVSEIAQVAIQKASQNSDDLNKLGNAARKPAPEAFDSVKEAFTQNPVQHGASVLAGAVNQVNPSLSKLATAVKDATQTTEDSIRDNVGDTVDAAQDTAENITENVTESVGSTVGSTVDVMDDAVRDAIQQATEKVVSLFDEDQAVDKKSKKEKGKKKGKKKK